MKEEITIEILEKIYQYYNPLGQKYFYLVDEFLMWSRDEGDFYWIWEGAVELADGRDNPKNIIKELPFIKLHSDYKNLLVEAWLRFLNCDGKRKESMLVEYALIIDGKL